MWDVWFHNKIVYIKIEHLLDIDKMENQLGMLFQKKIATLCLRRY